MIYILKGKNIRFEIWQLPLIKQLTSDLLPPTTCQMCSLKNVLPMTAFQRVVKTTTTVNDPLQIVPIAETTVFPGCETYLDYLGWLQYKPEPENKSWLKSL